LILVKAHFEGCGGGGGGGAQMTGSAGGSGPQTKDNHLENEGQWSRSRYMLSELNSALREP
jgi:hypothetical protein